MKFANHAIQQVFKIDVNYNQLYNTLNKNNAYTNNNNTILLK